MLEKPFLSLDPRFEVCFHDVVCKMTGKKHQCLKVPFCDVATDSFTSCPYCYVHSNRGQLGLQDTPPCTVVQPSVNAPPKH